ncbi:MAG: YkgJ family cysteine cluster protein [Flammeovirgaceae bacterium]|nr:YkgJ family cysteine cluster protein [Flammeovirgaceae bacterium]
MDIRHHIKRSTSKSEENKKYLRGLKKKKSKTIDRAFHQLHDEVFEEIDCLECANCCKTTSPIFYQKDIERLSDSLNLKPGQFIERYLRLDEENDFVLQTAPCPFLAPDNYCSVYENRPKACREYPHTNRKNMIQILDLTYKNTLVCPAVLEIVERMKKSGF